MRNLQRRMQDKDDDFLMDLNYDQDILCYNPCHFDDVYTLVELKCLVSY